MLSFVDALATLRANRLLEETASGSIAPKISLEVIMLLSNAP